MTDPDQLARQVADSLYQPDTAVASLGIKVVEVAKNYARLTMTIRKDMLNGHSICHGGMIFTLADACFAYAANSGNVMTVSQSSTITFTAQAGEGDILTAEATAISKTRGRTGLFDVVVKKQNGEEVAFIRCNSYRLKRKVVDDLDSL